jgi:hypothetical protein
MMNKRNPVAESIRERQYHQRIVLSKKHYARHKEKAQTHAQTQERQTDDRGRQ